MPCPHPLTASAAELPGPGVWLCNETRQPQLGGICTTSYPRETRGRLDTGRCLEVLVRTGPGEKPPQCQGDLSAMVFPMGST